MSVTEVGHYTDSTGIGIARRLVAALSINVMDSAVGGTNAEQVLARFRADGRAGKANIIRAGHNNYEEIPPPTVDQHVARNRAAIATMVQDSERAIVMQQAMNSAAAYATSGTWYNARIAGERLDASFAADYPPAVYCRIHDLLLDRARLLPDLTQQDRTDIEHRLLPARWRSMVPGTNDGHYSEAGRDQAADVYVEHINRYNYLGTGTPPPPGPQPPPPPTTIPTVQARTAQAAVRAFGINTHFTFQTANDTNSYEAETVDHLLALGVKQVRQRIISGSGPGLTATREGIRRLHDAGVRTLLPMLVPADVPSLAAARTAVNAILDEIQSNPTVWRIPLIDAFAGLNEPNGDAPTDPSWWQKTRWAQQAIYEETRRRPEFASVAIQGPPLSKPVGTRVPAGKTWQSVLTADVAAVGDLSPWADRADAHIYAGDADPGIGGPPGDFFTILAGMYPAGEPFTISEAGYSNSTAEDGVNYTGGGRSTPETITALYAPKQPLTALLLNVPTVYAYEVLNNQPPYPDTDVGTREATFGYIATPQLAPSTWRRKAQFEAMRRYLALFSDPGVPFTPQPLAVRISTAAPLADLRSILFARRDGRHLLAIWRQTDLYKYNPQTNTGAPITVAPVTVTVDLATPANIKTYQPSLQDAATATLTAVATLTQAIAGHVHIIEITPTGSTPPPPPPPPGPTIPPPPPTPVEYDTLAGEREKWWTRLRGYRRP